MRSENVGVIYWQAPEIRKGKYDVMLVDIWSLGATVWELIEGTTPFEGHAEVGDRLPELSSSGDSSEALLDFLEMCSSPPYYRPPARKLLEVCCSLLDIRLVTNTH
jgi:serine/threonine-protein kinase CLA4